MGRGLRFRLAWGNFYDADLKLKFSKTNPCTDYPFQIPFGEKSELFKWLPLVFVRELHFHF